MNFEHKELIMFLKFIDMSGKFDFSDLEWQQQLRETVFPDEEMNEWDMCSKSLSMMRELESRGYIECLHPIPVLVTTKQLEMIKETASHVSAARAARLSNDL